MCDPLTIAGLVLTAGATAANYAGSQQVEAARGQALAAERIRQNAFDQEAQALNIGSQDRFQDFEGQQTEKAADLGSYFQDETPVADPNPGGGLPQSSSNITVREEAKQQGAAKDFTDQQALALGDMRSFGDLLGGISRLQARDAGSVAQIGGFKQGSSGVVPLELDQAGKAGDGMKLLGDLMGGAGSVATGAGMQGGNLFGLGGGAPIPAVQSAALAARRAATPSMMSLPNLYGGR